MPARIAGSFYGRRDMGETPIRQGNYAAWAFSRADAAPVACFPVDFNNGHCPPSNIYLIYELFYPNTINYHIETTLYSYY